MVLLRGLNYDYSGQQSSIISTAISAAGTTLTIENTEGFAADDYIVINPRNEQAEIVKITTNDSNTQLTIAATKFTHSINIKIYRLPYNQVKFYSSTTVDGTYVAIASSETNIEYSEEKTNFDYTAGTSALFYKRTFYNVTTADESDIALSDYWQTSDEELYITPIELRKWMQLDQADYPTPNDMTFFIKIAQDNMSLDFDSSNNIILRIALFLNAKAKVLRALSTRSVGKGYVTINAEGRQITKSFQELVLEAENTMNEYWAFINRVLRQEVTSTNYWDDTSIIDSVTRQQLIDIGNTTQNGIDFNSQSRFYGRQTRDDRS